MSMARSEVSTNLFAWDVLVPGRTVPGRTVPGRTVPVVNDSRRLDVGNSPF